MQGEHAMVMLRMVHMFSLNALKRTEEQLKTRAEDAQPGDGSGQESTPAYIYVTKLHSKIRQMTVARAFTPPKPVGSIPWQ